MNFTAQIKRGVTALVLCSAIGVFAFAHASTIGGSSSDVAPTRITVVAKATGSADPTPRTTTRVHVGRPVMVSVNPTPRQIARAAR